MPPTRQPGGPADDARLDEVGAAARRRLGTAPPAMTDAAVVAFAARHAHKVWDASRVMLVVAGIAGLAFDVPVLFGAAAHTSQDVAVLHTSLAVGFLVAAWRPRRYARGLAPVAVAAAVLLMVPTAGDTSVVAEGGVRELAHLPVLLGAAALLLGGWLRPAVRSRRAT